MSHKLWTRDFTIITLGTVVSMLGSALTGFAISLLVLDYTGSTFLYALFLVAFNLPKVIMPIIAGPYLDRLPRKTMIYGLDFLSSGLFVGMFFLLRAGLVNYFVFLMLSMVNGAINSVYQVAYDSLYPNLISEGNFRKAYSISSMIYPLAAMMTPVAAWLYQTVGVEPIFLITAGCFFTAACFETQIKAEETHVQKLDGRLGPARFREDLREGLRYVRSEPGLMTITLYFALNMLFVEGAVTLYLPFFKSQPHLGELTYSYVTAFAVLGRLIGGLVHYRFRYPSEKKTAIAIFVYIFTSMLEGSMLFMPIGVMMAMQLASGLLSVTSYNIRVSGTQSYVPDDHRARFNGVFLMATTCGSVIGPLLFGALAESLPIRGIVVCAQLCNILAALLIMFRRRRHLKPIYNQDL